MSQGYIQHIQVAIRSTSPGMVTVLYVKPDGRFIEIKYNFWGKKLHRKNQGSNFLRSSFSNRDSVKTLIQLTGERQS